MSPALDTTSSDEVLWLVLSRGIPDSNCNELSGARQGAPPTGGMGMRNVGSCWGPSKSGLPVLGSPPNEHQRQSQLLTSIMR